MAGKTVSNWIKAGEGLGEQNVVWDPSKTSRSENTIETKDISGIYINKKTEVGKYKSNIYILKQANGKFVDVWGNSVIDARMAEVSIGEEVKIEFLGEGVSKNSGNSFKNFDLFHRAVDETEQPF